MTKRVSSKTTIKKVVVDKERKRDYKPKTIRRKNKRYFQRLSTVSAKVLVLSKEEKRQIKNGEPTNHYPGSAGKIEVLRLRLANDLPLFHPQDGVGNNVTIYSHISNGFFFGRDD